MARREQYGLTWWGKEWLKALLACDHDNRLSRGKTYCNKGNVLQVDINPETYLLDLNKLKETLAASPKGTYKGMVLVDFAGYPHNMEEYRKVANEYGMWILEDACHAPGAYFIDSTGEKVYCGSGKYSDITVFSFHPVKHITTGEGGIACTQNKEYYEKMALFRTHDAALASPPIPQSPFPDDPTDSRLSARPIAHMLCTQRRFANPRPPVKSSLPRISCLITPADI